MSALSDKLREIKDGNGAKGFAHWCPGCREVHVIFHTPGRRPRTTWSWDGDASNPTVTPSMRITTPHERKVCHYFLKAGFIEFCHDSTHRLKGQTVVLPNWPYKEGEYGGIEE